MIDRNEVLLQLQLLAGIDSADMNALIPMVSSACAQLESRLSVTVPTEEQLRRLTYAAACMANYDLVCREGSRQRLLTNQFGKTDSTHDLTSRVEAAGELRASALEGIGDLTAPGPFLFALMDDISKEED